MNRKTQDIYQKIESQILRIKAAALVLEKEGLFHEKPVIGKFERRDVNGK